MCASAGPAQVVVQIEPQTALSERRIILAQQCLVVLERLHGSGEASIIIRGVIKVAVAVISIIVPAIMRGAAAIIRALASETADAVLRRDEFE